MNVLVTGAAGFIGSNLVEALRGRPDTTVSTFDVSDVSTALDSHLATADAIFHLAGVNRPLDPADFQIGNGGLTRSICDRLRELRRAPLLVLSSSTQAELENPYGRSKLDAESALRVFADEAGAQARIFRLPNVFGKWCRPNYNSVVATFCHNVARDLPISVSDPSRVLDLVYIDDVVAAFVAALDEAPRVGCEERFVAPVHQVSLGALAAQLNAFRAMRVDLQLPDLQGSFARCLYATYLSYLPKEEFAYPLAIRTDPRGSLAEFIKSPHLGQIFVSRTHPGITRGNHFHHTKVEKFLVLEGEAVIRFRDIRGTDVLTYRVEGTAFKVVDIPPGYTHSIENVGAGELVTLFWASEGFNPAKPDTRADAVLRG